VIARNIGGGFGAKDRVDPVPCIAALLSRKSKKPVKLWLNRREQSLAGSCRASHTHHIKIGVKRDGTFTAIQHKAIKNEGAFAGWGRGMYGEAIYTILYSKCLNIKFEGYDEYTNLLPTGPVRGWNNQESHFPVEALIDEIAHATGIDPIELRRKNVARSGDEISPLYSGQYLSSIGVIDCMEQGSELAGWKKSRSRSPSDVEVKRGKGMAIGIHYAGFTEAGPDVSSTIVEVDSEGRVMVRYAVPEIGTAHSTAIRLLVSEILRVNPNQVSAIIETANDEYFANEGIHGSRTTTSFGIAAMNAANVIKDMLLQEASKLLSCGIDDLQLRDGSVCLRDAAKSLSFGEIVREIEAKGGLVKRKGEYLRGTRGAWGFAAGFAEVEVDCGTGKVKVVRYVVAQDVGRVINPLTLKGQVHGAVAMGIGQTLLENTIYDPINMGTCLNRTFADYAMPTILDVPPVETVFIESNEPWNPVGAKGGAEVALVTVAPAICNAIFDAVGVRFYELPITPDKVLAAIGASTMKGG
jgi:xanthine dehydrogenase molybdenum-binding subunit